MGEESGSEVGGATRRKRFGKLKGRSLGDADRL